jgi:predicted DNA-binding protein
LKKVTLRLTDEQAEKIKAMTPKTMTQSEMLRVLIDRGLGVMEERPDMGLEADFFASEEELTKPREVVSVRMHAPFIKRLRELAEHAQMGLGRFIEVYVAESYEVDSPFDVEAIDRLISYNRNLGQAVRNLRFANLYYGDIDLEDLNDTVALVEFLTYEIQRLLPTYENPINCPHREEIKITRRPRRRMGFLPAPDPETQLM